jgi:hypothetical protein
MEQRRLEKPAAPECFQRFSIIFATTYVNQSDINQRYSIIKMSFSR